MRLKGVYFKLKYFLTVSNGDLFDVVWNIKNFIRNDINNDIIIIMRQKDCLPHNVRELEFEDILTKVTPLCLRYFKN